jgi:hypothetical protein
MLFFFFLRETPLIAGEKDRLLFCFYFEAKEKRGYLCDDVFLDGPYRPYRSLPYITNTVSQRERSVYRQTT